MLPLRYSKRWHAASMMLLLFVLAGITFVILALWFAGQYRPRSYWRIGIGLILFGFLIEGCQRLVTYRSADWFDIWADTAGIVVGLSIAAAGIGGWSLRVENWYLRRTMDTHVD